MTTAVIWVTKLVFAHLVTDFVLQPKRWIDNRNQHHFSSSYLYVHTFITATVAYLLMGFSYWYFAIIIFVTHTVIDGWKSYRPQVLTYFLVDQFLHLLVIAACWYYAFFGFADLKTLWNEAKSNSNFWIITTAFLFLSFPAGIMIGQMTKKWSDQIPDSKGLTDAGKWIGILERILILIFLLQSEYSAIGLLITAKGLLRFSEKDRQEEKTEYVLIGSLISVATALIIGILVNCLLKP